MLVFPFFLGMKNCARNERNGSSWSDRFANCNVFSNLLFKVFFVLLLFIEQGQLAKQSTFMIKQPFFSFKPATITNQLSTFTNNAMTRDNNRNLILSIS